MRLFELNPSIAIRFIPTYVGHAAARFGENLLSTVHPHIRGACWFIILDTCPKIGSSPHTWGMQYPEK